MRSDQGRLTLQFVGGEAEGIDAVIGQLAQEDHARHARPPRGRTGRQPSQSVELDRCGEADGGGGVRPVSFRDNRVSSGISKTSGLIVGGIVPCQRSKPGFPRCMVARSAKR